MNIYLPGFEPDAAWIDENTGRKIELLQKMQHLNN